MLMGCERQPWASRHDNWGRSIIYDACLTTINSLVGLCWSYSTMARGGGESSSSWCEQPAVNANYQKLCEFILNAKPQSIPRHVCFSFTTLDDGRRCRPPDEQAILSFGQDDLCGLNQMVLCFDPPVVLRHYRELTRVCSPN